MRTLIVITCLILSACTRAPGTSSTADVTSPAAASTTLDVVFDGDSLRVDVDGKREEVRLIGINAPERDECHGDEARRALTETLENASFTLIAGEEDRDRFGRLLRYVEIDGRDLGAELLAAGHGVALQGDHPRDAAYREAAEAAWAGRRGLWAPDACGANPPPHVTIEDVVYDAPGRDAANPNGEFVILRAGEATTLAGWILRDESSQHRFVLPDLQLDDGGHVIVRSGCDDGSGDLFWCAQDPVWSNGGDTAILQLPDGTVVDRLTYAGDY